jgi:FtsP/CotA-like multicopper oxidase with cupredoxin domain
MDRTSHLGLEGQNGSLEIAMPPHSPRIGTAHVAGRIVRSLLGGMTWCILVWTLSPSGLPAQEEPAPTFAEPPALENLSSDPNTVEVELTAAPERRSLVPGMETDVLAYNGTVPGPTLEVEEGDRVIVHFRNELDVPTTVHWHGIHLPFAADGSPFHPVAPGAEFVYEFTIHPGTAGTYWYHPHPHHDTGRQVAMGLFGAIVVRDPDDPLPQALPERLLILSDNRFDDDGQIHFAEAGSRQARMDEENGREGDVLFVNGEVMPEIPIRAGEVQRWRVINAAGARTYRLALPEHSLLHVGSDGGLFEHPQEVDDILLTGAERVELLVHGTGEPGEAAILQSLPYNRYLPQTRPADWTDTLALATVRTTNEPPAVAPPLPERLPPVPALDPTEAATERRMTLTKNRINGQMMEMDRIDEMADLGATEIWEVENLVGMDHSFHLHGFQFQVIERDGEPVSQTVWKDVVNVPKRSSLRFVVRFDRYPGKWMFHCHILDHEDAGMMGVLEVRPEGPD